MAQPDADAQLRDSARHRGYKLVKSRRRKPGEGDYGRFGLTDPQGKKLFGFGDKGLTATREDIERYLTSSEIDSWKQSAAVTPTRQKQVAQPAAEAAETEAKRPATRGRRAATHIERAATQTPAKAPPPPVPAAPILTLRPAKAGDAAAIAGLLSDIRGITLDAETISHRLKLLAKAGGGMLVADRDGLIGCIDWALLVTIHRGPIGRIGAIIVLPKERRRGIGRDLMDGAAAALASAGCPILEAMSDIDMRSSHGFFRALGFEQTSYRFAKPL